MLAILACVMACVACYMAGKRSLGQGLIALLAVGYFYGIVRANLLTSFSHFIFDMGLIGLYLSQPWSSSDPRENERLKVLRVSVAVLILWPMLLVFMPFQPFLISLVGLRGNIFFIPMLILGARLTDKDLVEMSSGLAVLNLIAFGFAGFEYFLGVPRFFPLSPVTQIIYLSNDVAGGFHRIPAIFSSAHAYGGSMVASLPYLIGAWERAHNRLIRFLAIGGVGVALIGILLSATRLNFVIGIGMVSVMIFTGRMKKSHRTLLLVLIGGVALAALTNDRFQRFKTLGDTDAVAMRISGSVNRTFFEILFEYPMGNGLGGGGTSIPYFLQDQLKNPIGMENEYSRILAEQGIIGLVLWGAFLLWFLSRVGSAFSRSGWTSTRRMAWCLAALSLGTGMVGLGLFTAIPETVVMLLSMGWTAVPMTVQRSRHVRAFNIPAPQRRRYVVHA
jgi:hypothetical protein